jgi:hypothetical protein
MFSPSSGGSSSSSNLHPTPGTYHSIFLANKLMDSSPNQFISTSSQDWDSPIKSKLHQDGLEAVPEAESWNPGAKERRDKTNERSFLILAYPSPRADLLPTKELRLSPPVQQRQNVPEHF